MARASCFVFVCAITMAAASTPVPKLKMNNGREIPGLALGTYLGCEKDVVIRSKDKELRDIIEDAIDLGYRHIDTAAIYDTEEEVGEAILAKIADGTVKREDIFVTTKLWNTHHKRQQVPEALRGSLQRLGLDYVDLYLMHWPVALDLNNMPITTDYMRTWRGMEDARRLGLVRTIGLSNFNQSQVQRVMREGSMAPAVLQIEIHPQLVQSELVSFAQNAGLVVMGYSPLGAMVRKYGMDFPGIRTTDRALVEIANKYKKTVPQIALAWIAQRNIIPVVKTLTPSRLAENLDIFDIDLNAHEVRTIEDYNSNTRLTLPVYWQENKYYPFEKITRPIDKYSIPEI